MRHAYQSQGRRWLGRGFSALAIALLVVIALVPARVAYAAGITVTTTADIVDAAGSCVAVTIASLPGPGGQTSLREAVCAANNTAGADTITLPAGTYPLTGAANEDNGGSGDLDVKDSLAINGAGAANTIIDGGGIERIFDVFPPAAITFDLAALTVQHGDTRTTSFKEGGAMYLHNNVTTTINGSRIVDNFAGASGAIANRGTLTINNSVISGNQTFGGGTSVTAGGIRTVGPLTINNSTISNNSVQGEGGGIFITVPNGATVSINTSTISGNTASAADGGTGNGGGIGTTGNNGTINITNSTISGNRADVNGGGAYLVTPTNGPTGNATLTNVTIANNTADNDNNGSGTGGGFAQDLAAVTLRNTVVALNFNSTAATRDDISGALVAASSYNLIGDGTGSSGITNGVNNNQVGSGGSPINPLLGALANNGGPTETHALLGGSPAINTANNATCPATDQRGVARPSGSACDIGAYELNDSTPPDTTITGNPTNPSSSATAAFTFTGSDNLTPPGSLTFQCQLDGGAFVACTSPQNYSSLADGSHTFGVRAVDQAGNIDPTPATFTWVIDATPPDTTITANPTNPSTSTSGSFSFTGDDGGGSGVASYHCQLDGGGFSTCTSPQNYSGLAEGSHTFQVRAVDGVGNSDPTPASYTWVVDTTGPETAITAGPANPSAGANASFSFTGSDPGGSGVTGFECVLDGGAAAPCTSPQSYSGLADGGHTFGVRAVDAAGNADPTPAVFTWTIDTAPPDTTIDSTPSNPSGSSVAFSFSGTDSGTGVASFECSLDNGAVTVCTSPQSYSSLAGGSHTFAVRALDGAGNPDPSPASFTWNVDATPPSVTINQASTQADPATASPVHFTAVFDEPVTGFGDSAGDVTLAGTAGATTATVTELPPNNGTTYDVAVSGMTADGTVIASVPANAATDAAGNGSTASASTDNTVTFIANRAPTAVADSYSTNEDTSLNVPAPGVLANDTDPDTGDTLTAVFVSGPSHGALTLNANGSFSYTPAPNYNGPDSFSYKARDARGAESSAATVSITVNAVNDPPTVTVAAGGACAASGTSGTINLTVGDVDSPLGGVTLARTSSNTKLVPTANIVLGGSSANRTATITIVPQKNSQSAEITITAKDGGGATAAVKVSVIGGTDKKETLTGTGGPDMIFGLNGDDTINAGDGNDLICGGNGRGIINGGPGDDTLDGANGDDTLRGDAGHDILRGGNGSDRLEGGDNDDTLTGNAGADFFSGGPGTDRATDFTPSEGDTKDASLETLSASAVDQTEQLYLPVVSH